MIFMLVAYFASYSIVNQLTVSALSGRKIYSDKVTWLFFVRYNLKYYELAATSRTDLNFSDTTNCGSILIRALVLIK